MASECDIAEDQIGCDVEPSPAAAEWLYGLVRKIDYEIDVDESEIDRKEKELAGKVARRAILLEAANLAGGREREDSESDAKSDAPPDKPAIDLSDLVVDFTGCLKQSDQVRRIGEESGGRDLNSQAIAQLLISRGLSGSKEENLKTNVSRYLNQMSDIFEQIEKGIYRYVGPTPAASGLEDTEKSNGGVTSEHTGTHKTEDEEVHSDSEP